MTKYRIHTKLMGCDFELIVVTDNEPEAMALLNDGIAEITRIERLLTTFDEASQTSLLNRNAGGPPIEIASELYQLIQRSIRISSMSQGAFDITAGALSNLYRFKDHVPHLPTPPQLKEALTSVGYRYILLSDGNRIALPKEGMRISFDAIGKGYAADKVRALWKGLGVTSGVINASGDLTAWGSQPDGAPWKIGIADPRQPSQPLLWLAVANASVATSGNYEQYFDIGGARYSHNIDPRSGLPVIGIKSVTVVSPSAELSDALATAVTVMGKKPGLHLIDQLPETHAIIIDDNDKIFTSKKIHLHAQNSHP